MPACSSCSLPPFRQIYEEADVLRIAHGAPAGDLFWGFGRNPVLVWLGGGLVCAAIYLVAVPDSDDPRENRDRAMAAGALIIFWPAVIIWLGPVFALA